MRFCSYFTRRGLRKPSLLREIRLHMSLITLWTTATTVVYEGVRVIYCTLYSTLRSEVCYTGEDRQRHNVPIDLWLEGLQLLTLLLFFVSARSCRRVRACVSSACHGFVTNSTADSTSVMSSSTTYNRQMTAISNDDSTRLVCERARATCRPALSLEPPATHHCWEL